MFATKIKEIGAAIAQARLDRGWTQQELADRVGVSRQWINAVEAGSPNARLGLVLRTLLTLDLTIDLVEGVHSADLAFLTGEG
ncbi:helix-turn-helix transcriptional regulator [Actinomyces culturomici]|uniref:helix-turn-helix transcriptional regulator n=1 Tax=Actinomyces culturomici TaxID=1926276 RepID=UPI000E1FF732|nr:helix-turn-helix domain-containing protein [Actinomyces culturomici]